MPGGVTNDQVNFYVSLLKKVRETSEWKEFMETGAFNQSFMSGKEYADWVQNAENTHMALMKDAGFLAKTK
jgi:tripartite-type tricarboxylate transporter receptor subunit TctC